MGQKTTEGFASLRRQRTTNNGEASQVLRQTKDNGQQTTDNKGWLPELMLRDKGQKS